MNPSGNPVPPHISIHAPHARSDASRPGRAGTSTYFNPRSSCEERLAGICSVKGDLIYFNPRSSCEERRRFTNCASMAWTFQSTLLMRGATRWMRAFDHCGRFQSTLLMRGATLHRQGILVHLVFQSTLLMRGATSIRNSPGVSSSFQSTLLMRGATPRWRHAGRRAEISIHAPHARSDQAAGLMVPPVAISIHAPHARSDKLTPLPLRRGVSSFQSTLLMRGAT